MKDAVKVYRHPNPNAFLARVGDHLRRDELRHTLMLRLVRTLIETPGIYPFFRLWLVEDTDGTVGGAALQTGKHNLVLAAPAAEGAVACLVEGLIAERVSLPGVVAALPEVDEFSRLYRDATGCGIRSRQDQSIQVIEEVRDVPQPKGAPRPASEDDLDLLARWNSAFVEEATPGDAESEARMRRRLLDRLREGDGGRFRLWADGEAVSLVGFVAVDDDAWNIGPVYTPPGSRRRGYATALTADVTRELLGRGARFCVLYTDLSNPTSNAIYHRIGYRHAHDSAMILFDRQV